MQSVAAMYVPVIMARPQFVWQKSGGASNCHMTSVASTASSAADTASATDSFSSCSSSSAPSRSSSVEGRRDPWLAAGAEAALPEAYLPDWCIKNTFVDVFEPKEASSKPRSSSVPARRHEHTTIAVSLEDVRREELHSLKRTRPTSPRRAAATSVASATQQRAGALSTTIPSPPPRGVSTACEDCEDSTLPGDSVMMVDLSRFPTIGSVGHYSRQCSPCAFFHTKGCVNGTACRFCHLCDKGEKKRRQKQKYGKLAAAVAA